MPASRIAIIDYGSGNLRSAEKAVQLVAPIEAPVIVSADVNQIAAASHIILPGVGAFADCMQGLSAIPGMIDMLEQRVHKEKTPFLGICVGMQLLAKTGYEHGRTKGLGWIDAEVIPIEPKDPSCKIPHMGWNSLAIHASLDPLVREISSADYAYFVHSYHMKCANPADIIATTDHGGEIVAMVAHGNIYGVQFHPEKSQHTGMQVLKNFLAL